MKPKWGPQHDKIVEDYERHKKEGKIKEVVIIPRDEEVV